MKTITFTVEDFKKYLYDVIESSYTLGMAYISKAPPFPAEEAIKRFQDCHWQDIKKLWNIKEDTDETLD